MGCLTALNGTGKVTVVYRTGSGSSGSDNAPTIQALETLSGHRCVVLDDGGARYPDQSSPDDADAAIAITLGAAAFGSAARIVVSGPVVEPGWNWAPGAHVFCGPAGVLTQEPPTSGWLRVIGQAVSPTTLWVAPQPAIILSP